MSFLTPFFLLGAAAIAGPVIFHLVRRATRDRTLFSSLMFLRPMPPKLKQRSQLDNLLLLILRCLALALLAFGFARPFLRQSLPGDAGAAQAKRIVVLVDVSASMRRAGLWDEARARAEAAVKKAAPSDQVAIFTFGQSVRPLLSFEEWSASSASERVALAVTRLAAISPGWEGTRLDSALITAGEALADNPSVKVNGPRLIVLVSDLQSGSQLNALQSYEWPKGVQLQIEAVKSRHPTNAGVQLVAESADTDRQTEPMVRIRVSNAADSTREQFQLGWVREPDAAFVGAPLNIYIPPGQSRVLALPVPKATPVQRVMLRGDDEDFDNTAFVIPPEKQRMTAIYVGGEKADDEHQPLYFLQRALPDTPRFGVQLLAHAPNDVLPPQDVQAAKLIFMTDSVSAETAAALHAQALAGKTIVFAPKNANAGAALGPLLQLPPVAMTDARPDSYAMLAEIDFQHPLFAALADPRFSDFTKIHIWKYRRLAPDTIPGARVVAKFDNGDPALLEIPVGKGRVIVLLTGWQPEDSQLGVSSKFVPLLYAMLEMGGLETTQASQHFVGDDISLPVGTSVIVRKPDGAVIALPAGATHFTQASSPGIYEIAVDGRVQRLAVNIAPSESRTAPLAADELERFGAPSAPSPEMEAKTAQRETMLQGTEMEGRQKLWRWFIVATLAVLLIESLLAGWTSRRPAASGGTSS